MRQGRLIATGAMLAFCLFALWQSLLLSLTDRLGPGQVAEIGVLGGRPHGLHRLQDFRVRLHALDRRHELVLHLLHRRIAFEQAIDDLDKTLDLLAWPLDCVHLGMGTDGHTASWFSDAPEYAQAINQRHRHRVIALNPKAASHPRMSLTASAILAARSRYIHITGEEKRGVLERALKGDKSLPISIVLSHPSPSTIYWAP